MLTLHKYFLRKKPEKGNLQIITCIRFPLWSRALILMISPRKMVGLLNSWQWNNGFYLKKVYSLEETKLTTMKEKCAFKLLNISGFYCLNTCLKTGMFFTLNTQKNLNLLHEVFLFNVWLPLGILSHYLSLKILLLSFNW